MRKLLFVLLVVAVAFNASAGIKGNRDVSVPYNMYVEPSTNSCVVTWEDDDNSAWNLRYRLYTEEVEYPVLLHSLTGSAYTGNYTDITLSAPWGGVNVRGGNSAIYIKNNYNNVAQGYITYTIPQGYLNAVFKVRVTSCNTTYGVGDVTVYSQQTAAVSHNFSRNETFEWLVTASSGEKITMYSTDNSYSPDMSLIAVYLEEPNDWNYVNDLDKTEYNIEGLERATDYEVQVQAIGDDGTLSDWCRPDVFTTLDEDPIIPSVHILGEVSGQAWAPDAGTKMEYDPETETYSATVQVEKDRTFGFSTELDMDDLGGWQYLQPYRFGPVCDSSVFVLTNEHLGQQLPLAFGSGFGNIQVLSTGEYEITVSLERNYIIIGKLAEPEHGFEKGDVNHDGTVNIVDTTELIDYLLSGFEVCLICADVNSDNIVNIVDLTELIDKILMAE